MPKYIRNYNLNNKVSKCADHLSHAIHILTNGRYLEYFDYNNIKSYN